ncbi:MAG: M23 family metallopeptidase [Bacteroidetes bacterium]|nr:M23 family metallopeptidase [Bacteroidota bacterium]
MGRLLPAVVFLLLIVHISGCAVSNNPQRTILRQLQKGIIKDDTSFVYQLPYEKNTVHLLVQGYFSHFGHKERAALDFKMKRGTIVCAARDGIVVRVKQDGNKGGWNKKYRPFGNVIVIQHSDSSRAGYWHLQYNSAMVKVGDSVKAGQPIALSGKTGYTLFPHLHFIAWRFNKNGQWQQVGTRFKTSNGIRYLKPIKRYRNG